jgi:hypothetical protein
MHMLRSFVSADSTLNVELQTRIAGAHHAAPSMRKIVLQVSSHYRLVASQLPMPGWASLQSPPASTTWF